MAKVMKVDASVGEAFATFDFAGQTKVCLSFKLAFDAAALTYWTTTASGLFAAIKRAIDPYVECGPFIDLAGFIGGFAWEDAGISSGGAGGNVPAPAAGAWIPCELVHDGVGFVNDFYIAGALVYSGASGTVVAQDELFLGQWSLWGTDPAAVCYIKNVKAGTTRGSNNIFPGDGFDTNTFAAWSSTTGDVSIVDDPYPEPVVIPQVYADLPWRVIVTDKDSVNLALLDHRATSRQFVFTLNGPATHTGQVASDDPVINIPYPGLTDPAYLTNNRRLVYAFRREATGLADALNSPYVCRFGGILMNGEDEGADTPTSTYTAYDPWQYMMSRPVRDPDTGAIPGEAGLTFPAGSRASDIALALLQTTEVVDGETHIDLDGTAAPLVKPTDPLPGATTFEPGLSVGEAWQQLVDTGTIDIVLPPLYDPLKPGKVCQFQTSPRAGETRYDTLFSWDVANHSAAAISRLIDGTRLANKVQFWADTGLPAPLQTDAGSVTDNGEWWAQQFFPGQGGIDWITLAALAALLQRRYGARTITFDPAPERSELPLRDYWLGDYVPVWASRNLREPLGIDPTAFDPDFPGASGYQRIQVIPINVDDDGTTRVQALSTTKENV